MKLDLDQRWTDRLAALPESGMGYQRVRVRLLDGRTIAPAIVLNAQILQVDQPTAPFRTVDIAEIELE